MRIFTTKSIILSKDEPESSYRNAALYPTAWEGVKGVLLIAGGLKGRGCAAAQAHRSPQQNR
ncbi:MAG TPA: hypothetical protein VFS12_16725, partial [Terriglobia bacterium]|nr:hypothetical protein [Terriglobia bacterium]